MKTIRILVVASLCAAAAACAAPAPPDTREADAKAIRDLEAAWTKDAAAKNVDKWAGYMAEDSVVLAPNEPVVRGRDKAKEMIKAMVADPNFAISFQPTQVEASKGGDFAYSVGTYSMTVSDKDKKPVTDKGKYVTVYKKQADGSWKAVADMFNSDMPAAGAPPQ